jgi:hypothetical protein
MSRVPQPVQCLTTDWTAGVRSPTGAEDFSSSLCVQTVSEAHPASCTMCRGGKERPGREADHSPLSSAQVKKVGAMPPLTQNASMAWNDIIFYNNLLISWKGIFLENLKVAKLVNKFPSLHGTRRFVTVLTTAHPWQQPEPAECSSKLRPCPWSHTLQPV